MTCPSCAHDNRPGAKFCEECATPLKLACARCGAEPRPSAKFRDECAAPVAGGAPAAPPPEPKGARKIVTIVFGDLVRSTGLHERLYAESARRFMERYYAAMRAARGVPRRHRDPAPGRRRDGGLRRPPRRGVGSVSDTG